MKDRKKDIYELKENMNTKMNFAIYANPDRLINHKHAWKAWRTLKDFGCKVYLIAPNLSTFEGCTVFPDLYSLKGKIDVVVPCIRGDYLQNLVEDAAKTDVKYIWFQENNWKQEFEEQCKEKGIKVIRGCVLKHKMYNKPFAYFNPCYWHGWREKKVPCKFEKI